MDLGMLGELIGEGEAKRSISRAFDLMAVAEEEIERAKRLHPEKAEALHASFGILYPGDLARYGSDRLYRAHARELLDRVARGADLEPGTDAECLVAFSFASLRAPLSASATAAMERVFATVFPEERGERAGREGYPGEVDEILSGLRRKISKVRGIAGA